MTTNPKHQNPSTSGTAGEDAATREPIADLSAEQARQPKGDSEVKGGLSLNFTKIEHH
jgi:hypothetical protein